MTCSCIGKYAISNSGRAKLRHTTKSMAPTAEYKEALNIAPIINNIKPMVKIFIRCSGFVNLPKIYKRMADKKAAIDKIVPKLPSSPTSVLISITGAVTI